MGRKNDTAALVASPPQGGMDHTISVRKIDNGYLVRSSSFNDQTGEFKSAETFSKNAPTIVPAKVARGANPDAGGALERAMDYLKCSE